MKMLHRQQGVTLVVALIMLVLLTLLALTSFNVSKSNLQVVSNMQQRDEAVAAAREVIEETISSTRFFDTPADVLANPCGGPNQRCIDTNGDGKPDVKVVLNPPPSCVKAQVIKASDLDIANDDDRGCTVGTQQNYGQAGAATGNSECANSIWEVTAVATDATTQASVTVTQGIAVRVANEDVTTNCH